MPGRLLPIANLALAGLAAFAAAALLRRLRHRAALVVGAALVVLVAADLTVWPLRASAADPDNGAYAALGPGRILELPIVESAFGSPYLYYAMQEPRERPGGYATARPEEQRAFNARWEHLNCGAWLPGDAEVLRRLGIRSMLLHRGLYDFLGQGDVAIRAEQGLIVNGWRPVETDGRITFFVSGPGSVPPTPRLGTDCEP